MTRPCVLITGASGMLGSALVSIWQTDYRVVAASKSRSLRWPCTWLGDLAVPGAAEELIEHAKPDLVVHAAAWTDVDACEADPARAMRVNAKATGQLAAAARRVGAAFVYISTESVFDGLRGGYREVDQPNPINQYAASKLAGEYETLTAHPHAVVLRIGLEGWRPSGPPGFVQWVVEGLQRGERRTICTDWLHTVVFAANLAEVLDLLWKAGIAGVYHVGADTPATNWEIAQAAAKEFGLDASLLIPITSDSLPLRASRPKNVSLICDRLRETIGPIVWDLPRGLAHMHLQETSGDLDILRFVVRS